MMMETQEQVLLRWNQWEQRVVRLTSAGRGRLPPSGRTWFVSQIWALLSTSWTWWNHAQLSSVRKTFRCEPLGQSWKKFKFTEEWTNSLLLCPDSHAGSLLWGTGQTCVWSPCPVLTLTHPGPPSPDPPRWNHKALMFLWRWDSMNWWQSKGHQPEVALLAVIFLHGIQGAHSSVLFQTHAIRKKVFPWSFSGRRQQGPHHDLVEVRRTLLKEIRNNASNKRWWKYCCTCGCTQSQSLHHVSNGLNPPISDDRHPKTSGVLCNLVHRCTLGPPAGHHCTFPIGYKIRLVFDSVWCELTLNYYHKPFIFESTFLGDADGATAHAHPQSIDPGVDQVFGLCSCHH